MGDAPKLVLDFLDFPPFWITFKLLYCTKKAIRHRSVRELTEKSKKRKRTEGKCREV